MSIDAKPLNIGGKNKKYHVKTTTYIQHNLKGDVYFSELDMGYRFRQVSLSTDTSKDFVPLPKSWGAAQDEEAILRAQGGRRNLPPGFAQDIQGSERRHN